MSSSSGEEDGSAEWMAAVDSLVATTTYGLSIGFSNGSTKKTANPINHSTPNTENEDEEDDYQQKAQKLKHYQIKAQKLLEDILEKTLEVVRDPVHVPDNDDTENDGGVRLFKHSSRGIVIDHIEEFQGPKKRPRLLPGKDIDMESKKFKRQLKSVVVDGVDILAAARDTHQKSLARVKAKEVAAKEKAKREEERVAELKRIRGERWLPCIAKEKQKKANARQKKKKKKEKLKAEVLPIASPVDL